MIYALRAGYTAFARVTPGVNMPVGKAYLELESESARTLTIDFGDGTTQVIDVEDLSSLDDGFPAVNLNGHHVSRHYKGIVINQGIKILQR